MQPIPSLLLIGMVAISSAIDAHTSCTAQVTAKSQPSVQNNAIQQALKSLNEYASIQRGLNLQNPDLAYAMRKALVMADLLVKSDGRLNVTLCPLVKSAFIPATPEEYEVNMGRVLDQLDSSWQAILSNVKAPNNPNSVSALVLRALFSLRLDQPITDRHAKVAVIGAMLAPYNQGPVGDCFAVNDVIRDHQEYYRHAAEDYASIVMQGYVKRLVNDHVDYFFFLPVLTDDDRNQPFSLTVSGTFPNTNYSLFDAPGFTAALSLMGGNGIPSLAEDVMKLLSKNVSGNTVRVTPLQVLAAIAQAIAAKIPNTEVHALYALGEYGFSSLTNQPVLRAVEAAFAAMAEDRPNDSTRGNINSCIEQALTSTWENLKDLDGTANFKQAFTQAFNSSYRLLYNLNIPLAQVSSDGSSTDGGFQLYERIPENPTQAGISIATPQALRQLVLDTIARVEKQLGSTANAQTIAKKMISVVNTDDFLKNALWAYDQANQQEPDPIQNYQKLVRTPMQSCDGDNPYEVDDIDTGTSYDKNVQSYTPTNAKDLITWCLSLAKTAPAELIPLDSPQHAFNFAPANPDIVAFLKKHMPINQWLQNVLVIPGMQVARQPIDLSTQNALANAMYQQIAEALPDQSSYQQLTQGLRQKKLSVQGYANALLSGINQLLRSTQDQEHQIALILDTLLLQSLPANDQAILGQSAIRFAFTNWNEGTKDIYFCAFFNPRTEQVGFGTIFEDKTNLQPMDEDAWVNHQQWDVDLTPSAPTSAPKS